ncbi:hypothetical protein DB347_05690 [Opitutaceae bacterium EW11]|nr:hypothetical protein DB347_05690 [Opitutaceae bacterium EW11]
MITRPLDLSTRLRPPPRSYDYLFWVNGVLIVLFFLFFGSRFVLSPGMGVARSDDMLPIVTHAVAGAVPTQLRVEVAEGGKLCIDTGFVSKDKFREWLAAQAKRHPGAVLLVQYNKKNDNDLMTEITNAANEVGLRVQQAALDRGSRADTP